MDTLLGLQIVSAWKWWPGELFCPKLWQMFTAKIIKYSHGKQEFWKHTDAEILVSVCFSVLESAVGMTQHIDLNDHSVAESLLNKNHPMTPIPESNLVTVAQWDVCRPSPIHWVLQRDGSVPTNSSPARRSWVLPQEINIFAHLWRFKGTKSIQMPFFLGIASPRATLHLCCQALLLSVWGPGKHPRWDLIKLGRPAVIVFGPFSTLLSFLPTFLISSVLQMDQDDPYTLNLKLLQSFWETWFGLSSCIGTHLQMHLHEPTCVFISIYYTYVRTYNTYERTYVRTYVRMYVCMHTVTQASWIFKILPVTKPISLGTLASLTIYSKYTDYTFAIGMVTNDIKWLQYL